VNSDFQNTGGYNLTKYNPRHKLPNTLIEYWPYQKCRWFYFGV